MHEPTIDDSQIGNPDQPPRRGWFGRHWVWIVPLTTITLLLSCCGGAFVLTMSSVFGLLRENAVYEQALTEIQASPEVQAALGTPIEDGWMTSGSISLAGNGGTADLRIPLEGPAADGVATVRGTLADGVWTIDTLRVETPDGTLDLRASKP